MLNIETYIQPGDYVKAVPRSSIGNMFTGRVQQVGTGEPGAREILILSDGENLDNCLIEVSESAVVLRVLRGDAWVQAPVLLTLEQAEKKVERNGKNQRRRIEKKYPLFADQIEVEQLVAGELVERFRADAQKDLEREHAKAIEATDLRSEVHALVTADEYEHLLKRRTAYPQDGLYGVLFWRQQLNHIQATGRPDILPPPPPSVRDTLNIPWLSLDGPAIWQSAPGGPQKVRVLFFGRTEILCKLTGQPICDYDPVLIPRTTIWLKPTELKPNADL